MIVLVFAVLSLCLSAAIDQKVVIRIPSPTQDMFQDYYNSGADIAAYRPDVYLDLVIPEAQIENYRLIHPSLCVTQTEAQLKANLDSTLKSIPGYHDYNTMISEINAVQASHPDLVQTQTIGTGWGAQLSQQYPAYASFNHNITAIKVSANVAVDDDEPAIYFCGAHHAREPMGVEVCLAILNHLVNSYGTDPFVTQLLNTTQIWIVPLVNPDGHKIVIDQTDVWWRKNLRDNNNNHTFDSDDYGYGDDGVDLNRNYGYEWGYISATDDNNAVTYHGTAAFSEPETQAFKAFLESKPFIAGISYHTYGQYVLYPYGYVRNVYAPDEQELRTLAESVASHINGQTSGYYDPMPAWELYPVSGGLDDWAYGERGIFAYTIEMAEEFIPTATNVNQIVQSNLNGAMEFLTRRNRSMLEGHVYTYDIRVGIPAHVYVEGIDDSPVSRAPYRAMLGSGSYWRFLPPGTYTVHYFLEGFESQTHTVTISSTTTTLLDVMLIPLDYAYEATLRVRDGSAQAAPIEGATLTLKTDPERIYTSDAEGKFTLNWFFIGDYLIELSKPGYHTIRGLAELQDGLQFRLMQNADLNDDFESGLSQWTATTPWGLSSTQAHSGQYSLTDSPSGNYQNNQDIACTLVSPLSLIGARSINLQLFTKFNIALDGDYAVLEYSLNNGYWQELDYFTGVSDWAQKSYDLTSCADNDIRFRFKIVTNSSGRADGIYFDDIQLFISYYEPTSNNDPSAPQVSIHTSTYPNPFSSELNIKLESESKLTEPIYAEIYNLRGQKVFSSELNGLKAGDTSISWIPGLTENQPCSGVYIVNIKTMNKTLSTQKVLLLK